MLCSICKLFQDGLAEVTLDTDNLPAVRPVPNKKRNERAECKQVVIALTMQDFEVREHSL